MDTKHFTRTTLTDREASAAARQLWNDMDFLKSQPIRLLFSFFERDQWRPESTAGRKLLTGLLYVLPDSKIVEDVHGDLRKEAKSHPNAKLTPSHVQEIIVRSKVFASRGVHHPAEVSRDSFIHKYKSVKRVHLNRQHFCQKHKMSLRWIKIVGRRSWKPLTEEGCHGSQAAFRWLLNRPPGEQLEKALFSKLVFPYVVICSADGLAYASLGNAAWAVLAWPLSSVADGFVFQPNAGVVWLHVVNPSQWDVIEVEGAFCMSTGIILRQVGAPMALIRYFALRHPHSNKIGFQDVCRVAVHLDCFDVSTAAQQSRDQLMQSICQHFGDVYEPKRAAEEIVSDPVQGLGVFDEAVFEEFDKTEQLEFPEICKQLKQKKARRVAADFRVQTAKATKAKAQGKRKAQPAKAKAKAKRQRVAAAPEVDADVDVVQPEDEAEEEAALQPEPPDPVPPVVPVVIAAVPAPPLVPPAAESEPAARGPRVRHAEGFVPWENFECESCNQVCGQFRLEPFPGGRETATWHMRVRQPGSMEWALRAPLHRSRRTSVVGDTSEYALDWIRQHKQCQCNAAA